MTAKKARVRKVDLPFVHTNHYQTELEKYQAEDYDTGLCRGTQKRFKVASERVDSVSTMGQFQQLLSNQEEGQVDGIFNERTIGRMIVDFENRYVSIWMLREDEKGWVEYGLG
jgi:hypothetical protein